MEKYSLAGTRTFARLDYLNESSQGLEGGHQNMVRLSLQNTSEQPLSQEGQASDDLTEQFMRGDKSRHSDGSGLGLHIAKSLAELMGGELTISASGDQFKVTLLLVGAGNE
jgi:signal transduction histidine kinase